MVFLSQCLSKSHAQRSITTVKNQQWSVMMIAAREVSPLVTSYKHSITIRSYNVTWGTLSFQAAVSYTTVQAHFHTFWFSFMWYYNKGLGEGLLVVHHSQNHIHIERSASFIRRNALQVEEVRSESHLLPAPQLPRHQFYPISFTKKREESPNNPI